MGPILPRKPLQVVSIRASDVKRDLVHVSHTSKTGLHTNTEIGKTENLVESWAISDTKTSPVIKTSPSPLQQV